jgi:hypothetical protein
MLAFTDTNNTIIERGKERKNRQLSWQLPNALCLLSNPSTVKHSTAK